MANSHMSVHDAVSNLNHLNKEAVRDSTAAEESVLDMAEFRVIMAYAKRRRESPLNSVTAGGAGTPNGATDPSDATSPETPAKIEGAPVKRGKRRWKRLTSILRCIKPPAEDPQRTPKTKPEGRPGANDRCFPTQDDVKNEEFEDVACRLMQIADEIPFAPPDLETDDAEDYDPNVERLIGLLLRDSGDRLNEMQELQEALRATERLWSYAWYEAFIKTLLRKMGLWNADPEAPGPKTSPKTQIAVTCEVTSRLSAVDTLPMNRLMGYGAKYLQNHFSTWVKQQGGYEEAFKSDDEEDVQ
ncbi:uncharacterized protein ACBR49_010642 [Aulostomus maculatus]